MNYFDYLQRSDIGIFFACLIIACLIYGIAYTNGRSENPVYNRLKAKRHKFCRLLKNARMVRDQAVRNAQRNLHALECQINAYSYLQEQNVKLQDQLTYNSNITEILKKELNRKIDECEEKANIIIRLSDHVEKLKTDGWRISKRVSLDLKETVR